VDNLERVLENANSHELLAVVATEHHHGVHDALNNGALVCLIKDHAKEPEPCGNGERHIGQQCGP
jgi:hypothetical protein